MPPLLFLARSLPCFTQKTHPFGCVFASLLRFHFVVCGVVVLLPFKAVVLPFVLRRIGGRRFFDDSDRNENADDRGADLGEMRHIRADEPLIVPTEVGAQVAVVLDHLDRDIGVEAVVEIERKIVRLETFSLSASSCAVTLPLSSKVYTISKSLSVCIK